MPPVSRIGDIALGHSCYPPSAIIQASSNVFANSIAVHRLGDSIQSHACPGTPPHGRNSASGSTTVYTNSKQTCGIGDAVNCGGIIAQGSSNVFRG